MSADRRAPRDRPGGDSTDLTPLVRSWLHERNTPLPAHVRSVVIERLPATSQRRRWWPLRHLSGDEGETRSAPEPHIRMTLRTYSMLTATNVVAATAVVAVGTALLISQAQLEDTAPATPAGATHQVAADGSGDFASIAEALAAAQDGDTIEVGPGSYADPLVITDDVTITGEGDRDQIVIEVDSDGSTRPGVTFLDSGASLSGMTLKGEGSGVRVTGGAPTLHDLAFVGIGQRYQPETPMVPNPGFFVELESTATISGSLFEDVYIFVTAGAKPTISDNRIEEGWLDVSGGQVTPVIERNTFDGTGINIGSFAAPIVTDNTIAVTEDGIWVGVGSAPTISRNTISGSDGVAIGVEGGSGSLAITDNDLSDNHTGIHIEGGSPTLTGNIIQRNQVGVEVTGGSPTLSDNLLCDNAADLVVAEGVEPPELASPRACPA